MTNTSTSSATIITTVTEKGGNGKSSVVLNVCHELGRIGKKCLMIDEDPQGSLGKNILGEEELSGYPGLEDIFLNPSLDPSEYIQPTKMDHVWILPCHSSISGVPAKLLYEGDGFFTLKGIVKMISGFDYIVIDTPGNLEFLTLSALIAADHLLIPVYPGFFSLYAINTVMRAIDRVKRNFGASCEVLGVLVTMMDRRANLYKEIEKDVRDFFGGKVFETTTTRTVKMEESLLHSVGISGVYPDSVLAGEYESLSAELLQRLEAVSLGTDRLLPDHPYKG